MDKFVIENIFEHHGLTCVVLIRSPGVRLGYVGIPKGHCLYGRYTDSHLEITKDELSDREVDGWFQLFSTCLEDDPRIRLDAYFRVHGGITYSFGGKGSTYPISSDLWWFGFDCAHAGDRNDYATAKQLFANDAEEIRRILFNEKLDNEYAIDGAETRSQEYAEEQCKKLAEQLAEFTSNKTTD